MKKKLGYGLLAGLVAAAVAGGLEWSGLSARWEHVMSDWRARALARPSVATEQVKLVLVDQASLDWASRNLGWSWPWPREAYAVIIQHLQRQGARVVALDVLFTEPSAYGVADDEALGTAMGGGGAVVAAVFLGRQADQATAWPEGLAARGLAIEGLEGWLESRPAAVAELTLPGGAFPVPEVAGQTACLGNTSETPDGDGVFRRAAPFRLFDGRAVASLGMAGWLAGLEAEGVAAAIGDDGLEAAGRRIPLDGRGRMIVKYRGPSGTHGAFSAAGVIQAEMRILEGGEESGGADVSGCHVVFGFSAPGLKDLRPTPMGGDYPGPEIYATVLDNLLAGDFMRDAPPWAVRLWLVALALVAGAAAAAARNAWQSALAALGMLVLPTLAGFGVWPLGVVLPMAGPTAGVGMALLGGAMVNFVLEGRQKMFIKGAFKHYLSPVVIEQIMRDPGSLKLGGERRELSIFFSDLEGFSAISERLGPEELTALLNDYLTDMTDIILEEGGTLDKYEGDAIIAFWNAPLAQEDHAARAVRAAVRCQQKLAERQTEFAARAGTKLKMRIGLNTGPVVVGNMGSHQRFDYTVLGDAANLASRLEGANKALGTYLMIAESTWQATGGLFPGRELGELTVVGRKTPVRVFEATGLEGVPGRESDRAFADALALARAGRWAEAAEAFGALADDAAAATYAKRCRELADRGAAAWDGVWNLTEK